GSCRSLDQHRAPIHRTCNMNGSVRRDTGYPKTSALLHRDAFRQGSNLILGHHCKLRGRAKRTTRLGSVTPHRTEPSRVVRLARPRSLQWCPRIRLLPCRKASRWSKALVLGYPVSRRTEPFMLQVL